MNKSHLGVSPALLYILLSFVNDVKGSQWPPCSPNPTASVDFNYISPSDEVEYEEYIEYANTINIAVFNEMVYESFINMATAREEELNVVFYLYENDELFFIEAVYIDREVVKKLIRQYYYHYFIKDYNTVVKLFDRKWVIDKLIVIIPPVQFALSYNNGNDFGFNVDNGFCYYLDCNNVNTYGNRNINVGDKYSLYYPVENRFHGAKRVFEPIDTLYGTKAPYHFDYDDSTSTYDTRETLPFDVAKYINYPYYVKTRQIENIYESDHVNEDGSSNFAVLSQNYGGNVQRTSPELINGIKVPTTKGLSILDQGHDNTLFEKLNPSDYITSYPYYPYFPTEKPTFTKVGSYSPPECNQNHLYPKWNQNIIQQYFPHLGSELIENGYWYYEKPLETAVNAVNETYTPERLQVFDTLPTSLNLNRVNANNIFNQCFSSLKTDNTLPLYFNYDANINEAINKHFPSFESDINQNLYSFKQYVSKNIPPDIGFACKSQNENIQPCLGEGYTICEPKFKKSLLKVHPLLGKYTPNYDTKSINSKDNNYHLNPIIDSSTGKQPLLQNASPQDQSFLQSALQDIGTTETQNGRKQFPNYLDLNLNSKYGQTPIEIFQTLAPSKLIVTEPLAQSWRAMKTSQPDLSPTDFPKENVSTQEWTTSEIRLEKMLPQNLVHGEVTTKLLQIPSQLPFTVPVPKLQQKLPIAYTTPYVLNQEKDSQYNNKPDRYYNSVIPENDVHETQYFRPSYEWPKTTPAYTNFDVPAAHKASAYYMKSPGTFNSSAGPFFATSDQHFIPPKSKSHESEYQYFNDRSSTPDKIANIYLTPDYVSSQQFNPVATTYFTNPELNEYMVQYNPTFYEKKSRKVIPTDENQITATQNYYTPSNVALNYNLGNYHIPTQQTYNEVFNADDCLYGNFPTANMPKNDNLGQYFTNEPEKPGENFGHIYTSERKNPSDMIQHEIVPNFFATAESKPSKMSYSQFNSANLTPLERQSGGQLNPYSTDGDRQLNNRNLNQEEDYTPKKYLFADLPQLSSSAEPQPTQLPNTKQGKESSWQVSPEYKALTIESEPLSGNIPTYYSKQEPPTQYLMPTESNYNMPLQYTTPKEYLELEGPQPQSDFPIALQNPYFNSGTPTFLTSKEFGPTITPLASTQEMYFGTEESRISPSKQYLVPKEMKSEPLSSFIYPKIDHSLLPLQWNSKQGETSFLPQDTKSDQIVLQQSTPMECISEPYQYLTPTDQGLHKRVLYKWLPETIDFGVNAFPLTTPTKSTPKGFWTDMNPELYKSEPSVQKNITPAESNSSPLLQYLTPIKTTSGSLTYLNPRQTNLDKGVRAEAGQPHNLLHPKSYSRENFLDHYPNSETNSEYFFQESIPSQFDSVKGPLQSMSPTDTYLNQHMLEWSKHTELNDEHYELSSDKGAFPGRIPTDTNSRRELQYWGPRSFNSYPITAERLHLKQGAPQYMKPPKLNLSSRLFPGSISSQSKPNQEVTAKPNYLSLEKQTPRLVGYTEPQAPYLLNERTIPQSSLLQYLYPKQCGKQPNVWQFSNAKPKVNDYTSSGYLQMYSPRIPLTTSDMLEAQGLSSQNNKESLLYSEADISNTKNLLTGKRYGEAEKPPVTAKSNNGYQNIDVKFQPNKAEQIYNIATQFSNPTSPKRLTFNHFPSRKTVDTSASMKSSPISSYLKPSGYYPVTQNLATNYEYSYLNQNENQYISNLLSRGYIPDISSTNTLNNPYRLFPRSTQSSNLINKLNPSLKTNEGNPKLKNCIETSLLNYFSSNEVKNNAYNNINSQNEVALGKIAIAKYDHLERDHNFTVSTTNDDISLRAWYSKLKLMKMKVIFEPFEVESLNFMPIVKNKSKYQPSDVIEVAKQAITKVYGKPMEIKGVYSQQYPYAVVNASDVNDGYVLLWPVYCDCGCMKAGCECCWQRYDNK